MPFFRKKSLVIEARQLTRENKLEIVDWIEENCVVVCLMAEEGVRIPTPEGRMLASWGDWVIWGIEREFYPCMPSVFEKTYELVEE